MVVNWGNWLIESTPKEKQIALKNSHVFDEIHLLGVFSPRLELLQNINKNFTIYQSGPA